MLLHYSCASYLRPCLLSFLYSAISANIWLIFVCTIASWQPSRPMFILFLDFSRQSIRQSKQWDVFPPHTPAPSHLRFSSDPPPLPICQLSGWLWCRIIKLRPPKPTAKALAISLLFDVLEFIDLQHRHRSHQQQERTGTGRPTPVTDPYLLTAQSLLMDSSKISCLESCFFYHKTLPLYSTHVLSTQGCRNVSLIGQTVVGSLSVFEWADTWHAIS